MENVDVVREVTARSLAGDWEAVARLVAPEVTLYGTVGGLEEARVARGLDAIVKAFERDDLEAWDERRLEPERFVDAGDQVVVLLREYLRGRGSGVEIESRTAVVVDISGGVITGLRGYMDQAAALEAAGVAE